MGKELDTDLNAIKPPDSVLEIADASFDLKGAQIIPFYAWVYRLDCADISFNIDIKSTLHGKIIDSQKLDCYNNPQWSDI